MVIAQCPSFRRFRPMPVSIYNSSLKALRCDQQATPPDLTPSHVTPPLPPPRSLLLMAYQVHYAIEIAFRGSVLSGYACHLVGLWLSLVAFSLVIVLWSNTLNPPRLVRTTHLPLAVQRQQRWHLQFSRSRNVFLARPRLFDFHVLDGCVFFFCLWEFNQLVIH